MNDSPDRRASKFYIVGIGASAGGLDAIETFLRQTPDDAGLAYVIVQHLDPARESGLADLMQNWTEMPVYQAQDGTRLEPDMVYIIPPSFTLGLMHGRLQLMTPAGPHYQWRAIDTFFRSLADDQPDHAIGVILSGAGSDGSLGVKAIKGAGGLIIAQDPETAHYPSMPNRAIETGMVDLVLAPPDMPGKILDYVDHAHVLRQHDKDVLPAEARQLWPKIFYLLRSHTGHDFSQYKQTTIRRRVERRLRVNRIDDLEAYVRYLQHQPAELEHLFNDLLIGVTSFFREPAAFQTLADEAIRPLIESKITADALRIWVNGCSTGEEAYSIAILVQEQMKALGRPLPVQIFATDIHDRVIAKARRGEYDEGIATDVSAARLDRFFIQKDTVYRVKPLIRDMIVFAVHNTLQDPPFSNVDLVSCRNLLIYLEPTLQQKLIPLLHYALAPHGYLFLGSSETLGQYTRFFKTIDAEARLFQRRGVSSRLKPSFDFQTSLERDSRAAREPKRTDMKKPFNLRQLAANALLENYSPPAVIVNHEGDILYFHEGTGRFLEPAVGDADLNLLHMAREGLRLLLSNMVRKVARDQVALNEPRVQVKIDDHYEIIDVSVRPLAHSEIDDLLLVVFERPSLPPAAPLDSEQTGESDDSRQRVLDLERDLQSTREHLQSTVEDLETSNEELKSTNEELQSANEELQSANEELTSAKEELQSVNEELLTVNAELENKIVELSRANDDLRNLLTSVDIGIIFLDQDLRIMRFNPAATRFLNLREQDLGRPVAHLTSQLIDYRRLTKDAQQVLETLEPQDKEVYLDDEWLMLRIRPYLTRENLLDGVIITIANITAQKDVQQDLRKLSRAVDQSASLIVIMDTEGTIDYANRRFVEVSGFSHQQLTGQPFYHLLADDAQQTGQDILHRVIANNEMWHGELRHWTADETTYWTEATISPLTDEYDRVTHLIAVEEDITRRKQFDQTLRARWSEYRSSGSGKRPMTVLVFNREFQYILGEGDALPGLGLSEADLEGDALPVEVLPSELEQHYRAALRGDNIYFERTSGNVRFGVQVMPVRDGEGHIFAGLVVLWAIPDDRQDG